jgi:hypothetical protein
VRIISRRHDVIVGGFATEGLRGVDREGQDPEEGTPESNVVRLPRDWLGPRDELVPFGPAASTGLKRGASEAPGSSVGSGGSVVDDAAPAPPPSASDFWGEHSAEMHHALQGPPAARSPAGPAPGEPPRVMPAPAGPAAAPREQAAASPALDQDPPADRRRLTRPRPRQRIAVRPQLTLRKVRWRRWAERREHPVASTPAPPEPTSGRRRPPQAVVAAGALGVVAAVALAAIVAGAIGGASTESGSRRVAASGEGLRLGFVRLLGGGVIGQRVESSVASLRSGNPPRGVRTIKRAAHVRHHQRPAPQSPSVLPVHTAPAPVSSGPAVSGGTSSSSASSLSSGGAVSSSTSVHSDSGSGAGGGSSGGGSSAGDSSPPAGPVGPGAPFGPGHLG